MYHEPDKKYNLFELLQKADEGDMESMSEAVSLLCAEGYIGSDNIEPDIVERYISYLEKLTEQETVYRKIFLLLKDYMKELLRKVSVSGMSALAFFSIMVKEFRSIIKRRLNILL